MKTLEGNLRSLDTAMTPAFFEDNHACSDGKAWVLSVLGKGETVRTLLPKFERADWMLWTLRRATDLTKIQYVELAVICAKTVLAIYEKKYPKDDRPRKAIEAAGNRLSRENTRKRCRGRVLAQR